MRFTYLIKQIPKAFAILFLLFNGYLTTAQSKPDVINIPHHEGVPYPGAVKWKFPTAGKIFSSPNVVDGTVYIGSEDKNLYALDEKTGKQKWKFSTGAAVHSSPAVYDRTVYFGSFDGYLYAVDASTGKEKWKFKTGGEKIMGGIGYFGFKPENGYSDDLWDFFLSSPIVQKTKTGTVVYVGSSDGNLYALNAKTGALKWKYATGGSVHSSPFFYKDVLYIGSWDTYLYAVDAETGTEKWKFKTGNVPGLSGILASPIVDEGVVYIGARDGYFYALNAASGQQIWKYSCNNSWILGNACLKDDTIYFGTSDTFLLMALDKHNGTEKFRFKANGYLFSSPVITNNTILFGDFTGKFFAVDLDSQGKKWDFFSTENRKQYANEFLKNDTLDFSYAAKGADLYQYAVNEKVMKDFHQLGAIVSSPVTKNDVIYFGSSDHCLYALYLNKRPSSGKVSTKN